ncbi:vacuolar protein [Moniliophthora roreri]|nr:vacuolar protein [Moniliophthora roreri]
MANCGKFPKLHGLERHNEQAILFSAFRNTNARVLWIYMDTKGLSERRNGHEVTSRNPNLALCSTAYDGRHGFIIIHRDGGKARHLLISVLVWKEAIIVTFQPRYEQSRA